MHIAIFISKNGMKDLEINLIIIMVGFWEFSTIVLITVHIETRTGPPFNGSLLKICDNENCVNKSNRCTNQKNAIFQKLQGVM